MPRGKSKHKRTVRQEIGYNLRSARFFDRLTGRYVGENVALKFSGTRELREEQESFLEELFEVASNYFDSIEEFRRFAPKVKAQLKAQVKKEKRRAKVSRIGFTKPDFKAPENLIQKEDYSDYYGPQAYDMDVETEVRKLKRKFSKQTSGRYLYNNSSDLRRKGKVIITWIIIESSKDKIPFSMMFRLRIGADIKLSVDQWTRRWTHPFQNLKGKKHPSLIDMFRHRLLPSISDQHRRRFGSLNLVEVVGWHF